MRIIERIKREAERNGTTISKLCKSANVNYQTVWRSLKYGRSLRSDTLEKLMESLGKDFILIDIDNLDKELEYLMAMWKQEMRNNPSKLVDPNQIDIFDLGA
jgi:hypothetical protein